MMKLVGVVVVHRGIGVALCAGNVVSKMRKRRILSSENLPW